MCETLDFESVFNTFIIKFEVFKLSFKKVKLTVFTIILLKPES